MILFTFHWSCPLKGPRCCPISINLTQVVFVQVAINNPTLLLCTSITSPDDELHHQSENSCINLQIMKAPFFQSYNQLAETYQFSAPIVLRMHDKDPLQGL